MKKHTIHTNLIGRKVILDYPGHWKNPSNPQAELSAKQHTQECRGDFGMEGEIVCAYTDEEGSPKFDVLIESDAKAGQIVSVYAFAMTIKPQHTFQNIH